MPCIGSPLGRLGNLFYYIRYQYLLYTPPSVSILTLPCTSDVVHSTRLKMKNIAKF